MSISFDFPFEIKNIRFYLWFSILVFISIMYFVMNEIIIVDELYTNHRPH